MRTKLLGILRIDALVPALLAGGLLAGCGGGAADGVPGDTGAQQAAEAAAGSLAQSPSRLSQAGGETERAAAANFEGTLQQVIISLGPDAIRSVAGSNDLATVLALSSDKVIDAVHGGAIQADSIHRSTLEIDGRMGRLQNEGEASYTVLDGRQVAAYVVDPENSMIMTMDPAKRAGAAAVRGEGSAPMDLDVEKVGEREIRGFHAIGHRFEFMDDNVATVWLSKDLERQVGPIFDIWQAINPLGQMDVGDGAPVRVVMVNREALASGGGIMPAYTITEFYDLQPGAVADGRFDLPDGYQQVDMADLMRGAQ